MKMTDRRLTNDDIVAMKKLHQAFGPKFWERVMFVLTFANEENCSKKDDRDQPESEPKPSYKDKEAWHKIKKTRFTNRIKHRSKAINTFLRGTFHINDVPFSVAGAYEGNFDNPSPMVLPDRENWLVDFLSLCCHEIKEKHKFTKFSLNDSKYQYSITHVTCRPGVICNSNSNNNSNSDNVIVISNMNCQGVIVIVIDYN